MRPTLLAALLLAAAPAAAQHAQPYAGLDRRAVTTLSEAEVADLRAGRGMGMALPAELNGYPGPMHVLELATPDALRAATEEAGAARAALRLAHLRYHLATLDVLTAEQAARYASLRGYGAGASPAPGRGGGHSPRH